jgi:trehalose 6-phosphate synthase/phosphatase
MAQVIIVSNRLPVSVKKVEGRLEFYPSVGGLSTGLSSYAGRKKWIGWPGIPSDDLTDHEKTAIATELRKHNCYPVHLNQKQLDTFYNGYCNSILWPLFHNLPVGDAIHDDRNWKSYREINKLYTSKVLELSRTSSTVWVHDYQLLLLPQFLRNERPNDHIGIFLHIPFPLSDVFKTLPNGKQLLNGMLGANLIGFHTSAYTENFLACCTEASLGIVGIQQIILPERTVRVTDFPMGIDYAKFSAANRSNAVKKAVRAYRRTYRRRKVILTVDRLDPTKGLVGRLKAYQQLLRKHPELHRKFVMVMLATPSRTDIAEYQVLKTQVEQLVADINARFGTAKWQPVDYHYNALPFEDVAALYQIADIAFIAPLRDGMNLVAKEFVASRNSRDGVLILSETAGAAKELSDAILVNPDEPASLELGLMTAINMPRKELRRRMRAMQQYLAKHTVQDWVGSFIDSLEQPNPNDWQRTATLNVKHTQDLITAYRRSRQRLLLFDYDGTLTPIADDPDDAKPSAHLLKLLRKFAQVSGNEVIIISGRNQQDMETWFGALPLTLVAEHGAFIRPAGETTWTSNNDISETWKTVLKPFLKAYADRTPGAFVETKKSSLVWHYRMAPTYIAQKNLTILKRTLKPLIKSYGLQQRAGKKILEIKSPATTKGTILGHWLRPATDFIIAVGDDYTDEDMFTALPTFAFTIKVGKGRTKARLRVEGVPEVLSLIKSLSDV